MTALAVEDDDTPGPIHRADCAVWHSDDECDMDCAGGET